MGRALWRAGRALSALVLALVCVASASSSARAQDPATGFIDQRFAPVQSSSTPTPSPVAVLANVSDGTAPVVVRFSNVASTTGQAQVQVVSGTPGADTSQPVSGTAPGPGGAVWAVDPNGSPVSPAYDYGALVAPASQPLLPGNRWGTVKVLGVADPQPVDTGVSSPTVGVVNEGLRIITDAAAPGELLGQPVTRVADFVRLIPDEQAAVSATDFILIDRTSGQIQLVRSSTDGTMSDVTGDATWVGQGLPADPGTPAEVTFDLPAVASLTGLSTDPASLAVAVDRAYTLADGRTVTVYGVAATLDWFDHVAEDAAGVAAALATTTVPGGSATGAGAAAATRVRPAAVAATVALVVVVLAILILLWRRRRRRSARRPAAAPSGGPAPERTGGRRSSPVSPDDALSALEAEVEAWNERIPDPSRDQPDTSHGRDDSA